MKIYPRSSQCLATVPHECLAWLTCSRQQFKYKEILLKIQISYFLWNIRSGNTEPGLPLWKAGRGLNGIGLLPSRNSLWLPPLPVFSEASVHHLSVSFCVFFMCTCLICISAWPLRLKSLQTLVYTLYTFFLLQ